MPVDSLILGMYQITDLLIKIVSSSKHLQTHLYYINNELVVLLSVRKHFSSFRVLVFWLFMATYDGGDLAAIESETTLKRNRAKVKVNICVRMASLPETHLLSLMCTFSLLAV